MGLSGSFPENILLWFFKVVISNLQDNTDIVPLQNKLLCMHAYTHPFTFSIGLIHKQIHPTQITLNYNLRTN